MYYFYYMKALSIWLLLYEKFASFNYIKDIKKFIYNKV